MIETVTSKREIQMRYLIYCLLSFYRRGSSEKKS